MSGNHFGSAFTFIIGTNLRTTRFLALLFLALNLGILINASPSYGQRPDYSDEENQNAGEYDVPQITVPPFKPNRIEEPRYYNYEQAMETGYAAAKGKSYAFALQFFNIALQTRPGDVYAKRAISNMTRYLNAEKEEYDRQQGIERRREDAERRREEKVAAIKQEQTLREAKALRGRLSKLSNRQLTERLRELSHEHLYAPESMNTEAYSKRAREIQITEEVAREVCERNKAACPLYNSAWHLHPSNARPEPSVDPNFDVRNYDPLAQ